MRCPHCKSENTKVIDTTHDSKGGIRRRRECEDCKQRFSTYERAILSTPMIIKKDKMREEFNREKLISGIRIACAKRPVPAAEIERLAGKIESELQKMNKLEIPSRIIGDLVIKGLLDLDKIAYIRYAIVYLPLNNMNDIIDEINRLLITEGE
ncbi:MAG: transcriptional repressor NrdR [Anaerolineales bacterium]|nr:transcriptional repressor NrdR [Anaerolineales bacterium]